MSAAAFDCRATKEHHDVANDEGVLPCIAFNHINLTVESFADTVDYFTRAHGAQFVLDIPSPEWHAGVLYFGGVLAEIFEPSAGLLNARHGANYLGLEYQITPSLDIARAALEERGVRISRDIGKAIHTHPRDTFGIAMELCEVNLHEMPLRDAYGEALTIRWSEEWRPATYWRDEHPLGAVGMKRCTVAVDDLTAAMAFYQSLFGAHEVARTQRPTIKAEGTQMELAGTILEFQTPTGPGPLTEHLARYGDGIRSFTVQVASMEAAAEHLRRVGIPTTTGDSDDTIATDASTSGGLRIEFGE
jgi:catechol 2,3-dioxygenase-like lactoylglutathione lyase family enzyme